MSTVGNMISDSANGSSSSSGFLEFKKHASFFLKEKIKTARLTFTDVTPAQLVAEEATNGSLCWPDPIALKTVSKAAFEVDDYWRIVDILHKRLVRFDEANWRASYKALIVVEHLLTQGPERVAEEFQVDGPGIRKMESFQHVDDQGFNWGLNVRKKCERVLKLLERGPLLKEERERARKVSRGIEGFGSFNHRTPSVPVKGFGRSCSEANERHDYIQEGLFSGPNEKKKPFSDSKENLSPDEGISLLGEKNDNSGIYGSMTDHHRHPFDETEPVTSVSLLSTAEEQ